jgi:hypothetical protein
MSITTTKYEMASSARNTSMTDAEINDLISEKDAKNTKSIIKNSVKLFSIYCQEKGTSLAQAEALPEAELDILLGRFYAESRKIDGDYYAKKSLQSTRYGLQRHFDCIKNVDIVNGSEFKHSNIIFKSMIVKLKQLGKAGVQHKKAIHHEDMAKMLTSSALDQSTPRGLQNKVFIDYMLYFANRGRENLRQMTKHDVRVETDPDGIKYAELVVDKLTKTERGEGH